WTPAHLNYGAWGPVGDHVFRDTFTAARFGSLGLEFFVHEDYDADDHWLRSGSMEWDIVAPAAGVVQNVRGYVVAGSPNPDYHRVVRTVLRETVPGSLPATGAHPTTFSFDEGIQILGARFWTNDADFIEGHNDISDAEVWFDASRAGDNYLGASIARNTLTIRPEIGHSGQRNTVAEIHIEFYVSVQANFEGLYGAPIEVTVESGTVESPFEETLVVAYAWDPITASTTVVTVDEGDISAAFGLVRAIPVSNVVITEVEAGVLLAGSRLWVGVEGGISRGWGAADHISLGATHVTTNDPTLQFSPIRLDSHGAYVEIIRGSRYDGATITFHGVAVSGRVIPDHQYNIVVAGDAVAANWEEFAWVMGGGAGSLTRGATHGFFAEEPYATPAFTFTGQDIALDGPGQTQVPGTGLPGTGEPGLPGVTGPVARTIHQNQPFQTARAGEAPIFPAFEMINTYGAGGNASAFLAVAVVRDILGWTDDWNEVARTATFTTPAGMAIVFTEGSATVSVNGTQMTMVNTDGTPIPARISPQTNRFVVPIRFFTDLGVTVTWLGGTPGNFSLMVSP
ncbi:MAG: copper amine oxidase N-terminal domain-containing protein, partial [Defluviitaleaceae bacterium]|nr:copper amine oxidase N-terminal domain-containing protein [Defluviitaleaceae bacterium]